jgi:hypothetical protein
VVRADQAEFAGILVRITWDWKVSTCSEPPADECGEREIERGRDVRKRLEPQPGPRSFRWMREPRGAAEIVCPCRPRGTSCPLSGEIRGF